MTDVPDGAWLIICGDPGPHRGCVHDPSAPWVHVAGPELDPRRRESRKERRKRLGLHWWQRGDR